VRARGLERRERARERPRESFERAVSLNCGHLRRPLYVL